MGAATDAVAAHSIHSLLGIMIEHFEEMKRSKDIPWSSNTPMVSGRSTESSSSDSSPRRLVDCLLTMEEALMETKLKGNLLSRIDRLEQHVLKLMEEMNAKKKVKKKSIRPKHKKYYQGMKKKIHPSPVKEQQLSHREFHDHGTRAPLDPFNAKSDQTDDATKARKTFLLRKILHAGTMNKQPLEGVNFLWGSCRGTLVDGKPATTLVKREGPIRHKNVKIKRKEEEDTMKKTVLPTVNMSKLKSFDEIEVSKLFSLQGMQSYTPWEMRCGR